jgi:hypothetical protein
LRPDFETLIAQCTKSPVEQSKKAPRARLSGLF